VLKAELCEHVGGDFNAAIDGYCEVGAECHSGGVHRKPVRLSP
jgi:hypothetical protein